MLANFYNNKSDHRYLTKDIHRIRRDVEIYFKDDTELMHPTIKVRTDMLANNVNYLYISELGRYYFIDNINYSKQCVYLNCTCDVLMTYRDKILNTETIVKRNENLYNLYQPDEKMKLYSFNSVRCLEFPYGFELGQQQFMMGVVGNSGGGQ